MPLRERPATQRREVVLHVDRRADLPLSPVMLAERGTGEYQPIDVNAAKLEVAVGAIA